VLKSDEMPFWQIGDIDVASENSKPLKPDCDDLFSGKVTEEQIKQIFGQIRFAIIGPLFGAVITSLLLFEYVAPVRIYTWSALVFVSYLSFLILWARYKKSDTSGAYVNKWGKRYLLLSWIAVGCWGSVSLFLFSPDSFIAQMILTMSVMIGAAAITVSTIVYRPVFYTTILLIAPLFFQFMRVGDEGHYILALGCVGFTLILFFMNSRVNQIVEQSIRLRFSNYKLVSDLRAQKEIAEKSSMAKSSFLAVASHDLRQPLHAHGLFLGELRERLPGETVVSGIINKLDSSLLAISELFDSLLDISRLEAGVVETKVKSFFIDDFIRPIVEQYRVKAEASGLTLRAVLPHCAISTDRILLGRILRNLLENAVRNTTRGKILVAGRRRQGSLLMQVWDTGCGIKDDELDDIFKEYYQVKRKNNRRARGLGLGLAVVSQACSLLGHRIRVRSVFGKGSVFSIEVPLAESGDALNQDMSTDAPLIEGLAGMKVLVIDDDEAVRLGMSGILDSWKCSVIAGSDAKNVMAKLPTGYVPDAIIADYQLDGGKTGLQEIEVLNTRFNRNIDAAVITGDMTSIDNELGECRYPLLQKPVSLAKLCTLLRFIRSKR
jgi:two-component system, sensor histidine kinase